MKKLYAVIIFLAMMSFTHGQVAQTVIVEHFTNSRCGICASRNPALYDLLDNYPEVLHIAFHPSSPYANCIFSQHNPLQNDARTNYYGIYGGTPRVVVQGEVIPPGSQLLSSSQLENKLGMMSDYTIHFKHYFGGGDTIKIQSTIHKVGEGTTSEIKFYGLLSEALIEYNAPNGENMHHDVFREVISEHVVNLQNIGDSIVFESYYMTHPDWNQDEIYVIGMLQRTGDKAILQAAKSDFAESMTGIRHTRVAEIGDIIYPNPVKDYFSISPKYQNEIQKFTIYNLLGLKIREESPSGQIDVTDLSPGQYFIVFSNDSGTLYTSRLVKQ
jgi:hypothetical protein